VIRDCCQCSRHQELWPRILPWHWSRASSVFLDPCESLGCVAPGSSFSSSTLSCEAGCDIGTSLRLLQPLYPGLWLRPQGFFTSQSQTRVTLLLFLWELHKITWHTKAFQFRLLGPELPDWSYLSTSAVFSSFRLLVKGLLEKLFPVSQAFIKGI
jgi:hypothetical protein